ncbi:MAG: 5'/3'-nucleotidase SurE [Bacteroidota bacterium]
MTRPLILVTNDDGVMAPGIRAAAEALRAVGEVMVCAPDRERSAASHALTLDRPLRVDEIEAGVFSVDGTPADCSYLALLHLCPRKPALCVSGINNGYNLGSDVFYSGTVAGAVEAALRDVPSIAVSLERRSPSDFADFAAAAAFVGALAREALARGVGSIPAASLLNVNLPKGQVTNYQVTFLGRRVYRDQVEVRQDLRGRSYYWIGGPEEDATDLPGSDCNAVRAGMASITPLGLDLTHRSMLDDLPDWNVGTFVRAGVERGR